MKDELVFPVSLSQEQVWLADQLEPGSATYNVPCLVRLDGRRVTEDEPASASDGAGNTIEALKLALGLGTDVNAADTDGLTALHMAAARGINAAIPLLAAGGARLDVKNKKGLTALAIADNRGGFGAETADLLRQLGAKE